MAVDLGSTFKELIDEINSKGSGSNITSINGLAGGTLSSPLKLTGGDQATAAKIALIRTGKGQITDENTRTLFGFMSENTLTVGSDYYFTNIRGNANSAIGGKKFSDLAVKGDIPDISDFVKLSGDNTFTGTNTFSNLLSVGGSTGGTAIGMGALINVVGPEEMYTLNLPKQNGTLAIDGDYVKLTTDQTISGTKTFTSGSIVVSKTDFSNKTMKVSYGCNGIAYTPYGTNSIHIISFPAKDGTFALTSDIPSAVSANPALSGSEAYLTGLQIGSTKYKIPSGGSGGGSGSCTLDGLEAEYKESIENGDIDNVNGIPVLDVENTGYWTMVPVSELRGVEKKYYNHYVKITKPGTYGSGKKEIILNIVSTSNAAFTKNNIYLHLKSYQLCICNFTEYPSLTVKIYSAYISSVTTSSIAVGLIGGETLSYLLSDLEITDIVTLISDL